MFHNILVPVKSWTFEAENRYILQNVEFGSGKNSLERWSVTSRFILLRSLLLLYVVYYYCYVVYYYCYVVYYNFHVIWFQQMLQQHLRRTQTNSTRKRLTNVREEMQEASHSWNSKGVQKEWLNFREHVLWVPIMFRHDEATTFREQSTWLDIRDLRGQI